MFEPLRALDPIAIMAPDKKTLKAIKDAGGCALQCSDNCLGKKVTPGTANSWQTVPKGGTVKNSSGYSCNPCRKHLSRQEKAMDAAGPAAATRTKRKILSPNRGAGMSPGPERAPPKRRSEVERLKKGGYKAGRPYAERLDVVGPSAGRDEGSGRFDALRDEFDDDDEEEDVPDDTDSVAPPDSFTEDMGVEGSADEGNADASVDEDAASVAPPGSATEGMAVEGTAPDAASAPPGSATEGMAVEGTAPAHADESGFEMVRGQGKRLKNMSHKYLQKECAHWRAKEQELLRREARMTELEKVEARLVEEVAKNEAAARAAPALSAEDAVRADARRKLSLNGLADFPQHMYTAVSRGTLRIVEGTKRIFALYLCTAALNMTAGYANSWTYPGELSTMWAVARSLPSAKACVKFLRGIMGFGTGCTAPKVDAELKVNFYGISSDEAQRATLRKINPADDGDDAKVGIFTGAIAGFCAQGGGVFLKADETDLAASLGETGQLEFHGDENFSAMDPKAYNPAPHQRKLLALCKPSKQFLEENKSVSVAQLVESFREARKFVAESQSEFQTKIAAHEATHAKLLKKYRTRRQKSATGPRKTELHNNQYTNLMKVTKLIVDAKSAAERATGFIALVDELLPACSGDEEESMAAVVKLATMVVEVVPVVMRLKRSPAKKLLAVFLHSTDHCRFRCVARFFLAKPLTAARMRLLYDKVKELVLAVDVDAGAPPLVVHGLGADGAYTVMLDGPKAPTNLQQLGKHARHSAGKFVKTLCATSGHGTAAEKVHALHEKWRETVIATAQSSPSRATPPRTPDIFGWKDEPVPRDEALRLWAEQRKNLGETGSRAMRRWVGQSSQTPEQLLYKLHSTRTLPREERVVLDALLSLRPPPSVLPELAQMHQQWMLQYGPTPYNGVSYLSGHCRPTTEEVIIDAAFQWAYDALNLGRLGGVASEEKVTAAAAAVLARAEMDRLRSQHPELRAHFYAPELERGIFHECCSHKIKNLLQGLQSQREDAGHASITSGGPESWPLRLSVLEKAADVAPVHVGMKGFCCDAFDRHADGPYNGLASSETVKERLLAEGSYSDALVLDIIAEAQQAWTMAGLDQTERTIRLWRFSFMNFCLFGESLFLPEPLTGGSDGRRVQGLVPNSLLAMHANADGRLAFLGGAAPATRESFVEKCLSNVPDLENYFSLLVQRCKFKPDCRTAEGAFRTIDAVAMVKSDLNREFYMYMSTRSKHDIEDHLKTVVACWNDGSRLDPKSAAKKSHVNKDEEKLTKACDVRVATLREQSGYKRVATDVS